MRCLITGGAGFIGSHLAEELLSLGNEVVVYDDMSTGRRRNLAALEGDARLRFIEGSVLDAGRLEEAVVDCDEIYHLAAVVGVKRILEHPLEAMRVNMEGTANVLALAARHRRPVLLASSSEVYGNAPREPLAEDDARLYGSTARSRWSYAGAKAMNETLGLAYHRELGLPVVAARFFNVVGPRQGVESGMVIPTFAAQALAGRPITIYGTGEQTRCFAHVHDVARGLVRLLRSAEAHGEVFNIGNREKVTIAELARLVRRLAGSDSPIRTVPYRKAYPEGFEEIMQRVPDLRKIERAIGYRARWSMDATIGSVIEDLRGEANFRLPILDCRLTIKGRSAMRKS